MRPACRRCGSCRHRRRAAGRLPAVAALLVTLMGRRGARSTPGGGHRGLSCWGAPWFMLPPPTGAVRAGCRTRSCRHYPHTKSGFVTARFELRTCGDTFDQHRRFGGAPCRAAHGMGLRCACAAMRRLGPSARGGSLICSLMCASAARIAVRARCWRPSLVVSAVLACWAHIARCTQIMSQPWASAGVWDALSGDRGGGDHQVHRFGVSIVRRQQRRWRRWTAWLSRSACSSALVLLASRTCSRTFTGDEATSSAQRSGRCLPR